MSVKAMRALRGSVVAAVAVGVLAVSGCASADTAAIVNGHQITEVEVQEAASQIRKAQPDSTIETTTALQSLVMAGFINDVADVVGKGLSDSAARAAVEIIPDPTPATLELVKASLAWEQLTSEERSKAIEAASKAQITVNPRYGTFDAKTVQFGTSKPNWIKAEPTTPAPQG
jgi:hypothetical protein